MFLRVLGVLAGDDSDPGLVRAWAESADTVFAADGGVNSLVPYGLTPDVVIGDLDSAESWNLDGIQVLHLPSQDSTDCDKLLELAAGRGVANLTLIGLEGTLLDHTLAALHSSSRAPLGVKVALRKGLGYVLRGPVSLQIHTHADRRLSLLPLTECSGVGLEGATWSFQGRDLSPSGFSSVSNRTIGSQINVSMESGSAVLFVGRERNEMPVWDEVSVLA